MNSTLQTLQALIIELNNELSDVIYELELENEQEEIIRLQSEIDDYLHQARSLLPIDCKQLHCAKCGKPLTRNLREMPGDWKTDLPNYTWQEKTDLNGKERIITTKASLLEGVAQPYKTGYGCCDHDGTELECECGKKLGNQYFDCWQGQAQMWFYKEAIK